MTAPTLRKTICPLDCPDACGIVAELDAEVIRKVSGDPEHPFTRGFLCRKVSTYHERVQSPDRILFPMRRVGPKGSGEFERIDWESAWSLLVERLQRIQAEHGGEALLPYSYAGNMGLLNRWAGHPFFHRYGASRLARTICSTTAVEAWGAHYGPWPSSAPETALDADLIVLWGINAKVTNVHQMPLVQQAKRRGARLVVIDPYRNETAARADWHVPVRPAGDAALALALLKLLHERDALDTRFIAEHSEGFDELRAELETSSLSELCRAAGLELAEVQRLAELLAKHEKTYLRIGIGLSRNTRGAASVRAIACLAAARGLFDGRPGRGALLSSGAFSGDMDPLSHPQLEPSPRRTVNMVQLGHALTELEPPIHGLFVYSSNPLSVAPDSGRVRAGLLREDLFTVVHEQFMTPTARHADLLLPSTTSFENDDLYWGYGHFSLMRTEAVIPPRGEAINNFDLFQELGRRMGYEDAAFRETGAERLDTFVRTLDGLPEELRSQLPANRIVESTRRPVAGNLCAEGAPRFRFAVDLPDNPRVPRALDAAEFDDEALAARFPLLLITPPNPDLLNSTFGERHTDEIGTALIHPTDAESRGIADGSLVELESVRGSTLRRAEHSDRTRAGLVVAEGVYWEQPGASSRAINDLTSQAITDLGGGGTFHESRVQIRVRARIGRPDRD